MMESSKCSFIKCFKVSSFAAPRAFHILLITMQWPARKQEFILPSSTVKFTNLRWVSVSKCFQNKANFCVWFTSKFLLPMPNQCAFSNKSKRFCFVSFNIVLFLPIQTRCLSNICLLVWLCPGDDMSLICIIWNWLSWWGRKCSSTVVSVLLDFIKPSYKKWKQKQMIAEFVA